MARFVQIIEFQTSRPTRAEVSDFAARMGARCDGPPVFRNLDVMWEDTGSPTDLP